MYIDHRMDTIDRLTALFERFPGIGPRQAQRFVQFLLRTSPAVRRELADAIHTLGASVSTCPECGKFHASGRGALCSMCADTTRDRSLLLVVAHGTDIPPVERSGYRGYYFVLGGLLQLGSDSVDTIRLSALGEKVMRTLEIEEVVCALPANTEGDMTTRRIREFLTEAANGRVIAITTLGRGLSTGSEIEYADPDTIAHALKNRNKGSSA